MNIFRQPLGGVMLLASSMAMAAAPPLPVDVAQHGFKADQAMATVQNFQPGDIAAAADHALYAYLNMAQFFPHQLVTRQGAVRVLKSAPSASLGELRVTTALGDLSLNEMLAHSQTRVQGFIVLHHGAVVYERYPGMRPEDAHLWWSVAKVFAGLLTELLIDEGHVDREQNIAIYLPELAGSGWDGVRVDDVLNMASGVDALDSVAGYMDRESGIGGLIYAEGVLTPAGHKPAVGHDEALQRIRAVREPGTLYEYSSANTNVLGMLIERITGQRYADVVSQRIWTHIGAEGDAIMGLAPDGRAIAHGMFASRLRDLARFGELFTPSGYKPDVVPQRVLARIGDTQKTAHYSAADQAADFAEQRLGARPVTALAQWDALFADGDLYKSGFDGQALYVSPSRDVVVAMFSTSKDKSAYAYLRAVAEHFETAPAKAGCRVRGGARHQTKRACLAY